MIKLSFISCLLGLTLVSVAESQPKTMFQGDRETQTVFDRDVSHGGYGGLIFGFTHVNGELAYLRGTRGAWIINLNDEHAINLGFGNYRTASDFDAVDWRHEIPEPEMRTNYSGFEFEYVNQSYRLVHFSAQALIGSGTVRYDDSDLDEKIEGLNRTRDSYFALQPGVNVNLNITSWFRISGAAAYRMASAVNLDGTSNSDLSGVSVLIGLRFGGF